MRKESGEFAYYTFGEGLTSAQMVDEAFDDLLEIVRESLAGVITPVRAGELREILTGEITVALYAHWPRSLFALGEEEIPPGD